MRKITLFLSLFALLVGISATSAQSLPNWCDAPDGPWYYGDGLSRCNTQPTPADNLNIWLQGYYGALYDAGEITLDELFAIDPAIAGNIIAVRLPELLIAPTSNGGGSSFNGCYIMVTQVNVGGLGIAGSIRFVGTSPNIGFQFYSDTACQTPLSGFANVDYFTAANKDVADAYCETLYGQGVLAELGFTYTTSPTAPTLWECD